jgi:hypothetical protein
MALFEIKLQRWTIRWTAVQSGGARRYLRHFLALYKWLAVLQAHSRIIARRSITIHHLRHQYHHRQCSMYSSVPTVKQSAWVVFLVSPMKGAKIPHKFQLYTTITRSSYGSKSRSVQIDCLAFLTLFTYAFSTVCVTWRFTSDEQGCQRKWSVHSLLLLAWRNDGKPRINCKDSRSRAEDRPRYFPKTNHEC